MSKKFLCSDDSVNSYGFRVLTSGIQLKNFKSNPVGFFNHDTGGFWSNSSDYKGPVIRWEDITVEDGKLYAKPVFDENDPTGKTLSGKVENNFIRAASIGFRIVETSNDPALMEKGQTRPTVTKCELMEISVVDIPANKNALALYDADGKKIGLDDANLNTTLSALLVNKEALPKNETSMKLTLKAAWTSLTKALGFESGKDQEVETTPEKLAALNASLDKLGAQETEITGLKEKLTGAETKVTELTQALAESTLEIKKLKTSAIPPAHPTRTTDPPPTEEPTEELDEVTKEAVKLVEKYNLKPDEAKK